ncbi:MAG: transposase [Candidatus Heimdallarchaeota archaeon]|nr:transposase [Candidatus Heimdallarchaeota archaeon]
MRRNDVRTTVRLRIKTEVLTSRKRKRMEQISGRDTRIIKEYLRIIYHNEDKLSLVNEKRRVDKGMLDHLTLSTFKKTMSPQRPTVRHDFKKRFSRCSQNEFQECKEKAATIYHCQQTTMKHPAQKYSQNKIPRTQHAHNNRFILSCCPNNTIARWWVGVRDSFDSQKNNRRYHQKLWLPLSCSPYHEKKLNSGKIKSLELLYFSKKKEWWIHFTLTHNPKLYTSSGPPAVLGIDLGINKRAVSALLTPKGIINRHEIRFWSDKTRNKIIRKNENKIANLQNKLVNPNTTQYQRKDLQKQLINLRKKVKEIQVLTDHTYVNMLVKYILSLGKRYDLFVVVGLPLHIRKSHFRGNQKPNSRKTIHQWNFRRVIQLLKYKLSFQGWEDHKVMAIGESWTSSKCSSCGSYNSIRPRQSTFMCKNCGYEINADLNGAKNIAKRLISYVLQPKYNTIKDLLTDKYFPLSCFRVFPVLGQWLKTMQKFPHKSGAGVSI